jgi:hypothetical protein
VSEPPSLFEVNDASRPLADRVRPRTLADVVGRDHLLAEDAPIGRMVAALRLVSMILWGPPGCGKTTIARLLAEQTNLAFEPLSATFSGVADLRKVFQTAQRAPPGGAGHAAVRRRDPPLQPGAAGLVPPVRRERHHRPRRCDNRAPQLRAQRRPTFAQPGVRPETPRRHRPRHTHDPRGRAARRTASARRRRQTGAHRNGLRGRAVSAEHDRAGAGPPRSRRLRSPRRRSAEASTALRQVAGGALQPHLGAAQVDARLRPRRSPVLAGQDARRRGRPAVHRPPHHPIRHRRHRHGRPRGRAEGPRRVGRVRTARLTRGGTRDRAGGALPRDRTEVDRRLPRLQQGRRGSEAHRVAHAASAHPQRADTADEGPRLRQGVPVRPGHRHRVLRRQLLPRRGAPGDVLPTHHRRIRTRDHGATPPMGAAAIRPRDHQRRDHTDAETQEPQTTPDPRKDSLA